MLPGRLCASLCPLHKESVAGEVGTSLLPKDWRRARQLGGVSLGVGSGFWATSSAVISKQTRRPRWEGRTPARRWPATALGGRRCPQRSPEAVEQLAESAGVVVAQRGGGLKVAPGGGVVDLVEDLATVGGQPQER